MLRQPKLGLCLLGLAMLLQCTLGAAPILAQDAPPPPPAPPVRIGMVGSLFTDVPSWMIGIGSGMFATLMKASTGMDGQMVAGGEPLEVAKKLHDGKLDLAVFHGVEFAWAQQRYPDLRPLMVAVTKHPHTQAQLVVLKDGPIADFSELKGKTFAMPKCSRAHCVLFLGRHCRHQCGNPDPNNFFGKVIKPHGEQALDDVCLGNAEATVVDAVALEQYEAIKPGCYKKLRILKSSELFPTGVIVYREGALKQETLAKFRAGLLAANKSDLAKELFASFKITSFELVPENYPQMLADIMKVYPAPVAPK